MDSIDSTIYLLTDHVGRPLSADLSEPEPGSIILSEGLGGTAWQRLFRDGLWHSTIGHRPRTWQWLIDNKRNLVLVYDAPERN